MIGVLAPLQAPQERHGGGGAAFDVDNQFGDQVEAPGSGAIPADQDPEGDLKDFSAYVFTRAQRTWERTFAEQRQPYERAKLVLYRDGVSTGCGSASSAVGPFYCPADQRVYLDLSFYGDMASRLGAKGDFAWAYVIAHEVGPPRAAPARHERRGAALSSQDPDQGRTSSRFGWSYRPTASRVSGGSTWRAYP